MDILAPGPALVTEHDPDPLRIRRPRIWELIGQLHIQKLDGQDNTGLLQVVSAQAADQQPRVATDEPIAIQIQPQGCLGKLFGRRPLTIEEPAHIGSSSPKLPSNNSIQLLAEAIDKLRGPTSLCTVNQAYRAAHTVGAYLGDRPPHYLPFWDGTKNLLIEELGMTPEAVAVMFEHLRNELNEDGFRTEGFGESWAAETTTALDVIAMVAICYVTG